VRTRPFLLTTGGLAVFFLLAAPSYFRRYALGTGAKLSILACLVLLLIEAALPALAPAREWFGRWTARKWAPPAILAAWLAPYFIYAFGTGDLRVRALVHLLAVCAPPLLVYYAKPLRGGGAVSWADALAWLWLTLAVVLRRLTGIWSVPENLDFMTRLFVIAVASWCWVFVRPVADRGYVFSLSLRTLRAALANFAWFAAIAIPLSFATRFAAWNPRWQGAAAFGSSYVEILAFIAWLEELFFRGFLQTLASRALNSERRGQLLASAVFGMSHVLLGRAPNWRYVCLASIAGWFYGAAFRQTRNLSAPALTHALVDTVWRTWFAAP